MKRVDVGSIVIENATRETDLDRRILWILQADEVVVITNGILDNADVRWLDVEDDIVTISAANGRVLYRILGPARDYPGSVLAERLTPWPPA